MNHVVQVKLYVYRNYKKGAALVPKVMKLILDSILRLLLEYYVNLIKP